MIEKIVPSSDLSEHPFDITLLFLTALKYEIVWHSGAKIRRNVVAEGFFDEVMNVSKSWTELLKQ